jgi:hypothetical protein
VDFAVGLFLVALLAIALVAPRPILATAWVPASSLVALLAGIAVLSASLDSTYSEDNRAPALRIAIAATAFAIALPNAFAAVQHVRGKSVRIGPEVGIMLTITAVVLLMLLVVVTILFGKT